MKLPIAILSLATVIHVAVSCSTPSPTPRTSQGFGPREWSQEMVNPDFFGQPIPYRVASYRRFAAKACAWCGSEEDLEVHHIIPQHVWHDLSWTARPAYGMNDPENLVTLCRRCHFVVGHRCNFTTGMVTNIHNVIREANR